MEVYRQSKLQRLLKRIALMLCDGFRDLCEASTKQFLEMFYWQSLWEVDIQKNLTVRNSHCDNKSSAGDGESG